MAPALAHHIAITLIPITRARRRAHHGTARATLYRSIAIGPEARIVRVIDICGIFVFWGMHRMYRMRLLGLRPNGKKAKEKDEEEGEVYPPDVREVFKHFLAEWSGM